jgi:hypothetical protein
MAENPPKKTAPKKPLKKAMSATSLTDEGASASDKELAARALPALQAMQQYAASPTYLDRLRGMNIQNPEKVQSDRLATLGRVRFAHSSSANNNSERNYGWGGENDKAKGGFVMMDKASPLSKIAHEIGHNTNRSAELLVADGARPTTATGSSLAGVESWKLVNWSKMSPEIKKRAFQLYQDSARAGVPTIQTDPTSKVGGYDEHGKDAAELKSDLDGLRYLLYQKGVTKTYGEKLDAEKLKKAMNLPDVQKDEIFQRMVKQYDPAAIIELNNTIAARKQAGSSMA